MDTGFTEHSGCPVFSGEKKIVTQWIRLGVDDENTWDSFNTRKYSVRGRGVSKQKGRTFPARLPNHDYSLHDLFLVFYHKTTVGIKLKDLRSLVGRSFI